MSGLKLFQLLIFSVLMFGCALFGKLNSNVVPPTLVEKTAFPPPPATVASRNFYLDLVLLISRTGSVVQADLRNSSGDQEWDSAAVRNILKWKYSPATINGRPVQMRISQRAYVIYTPPLMMFLSEIICPNAAEADSVYAALQTGANFDSLATVHTVPNSVLHSGYLGEVDIRQFPDEIQGKLENLNPGEHSSPLPLGSYYAIFMRHKEARSEPLLR